MSRDDKGPNKATIKLLVETEAAGENKAVDDIVEKNPAVTRQSEYRRSVRKNSDKIDIAGRLAVANMLVPGSRLGREFQDQYRRIKRPLLSNAFGKTSSLVEHGNLILVTSSIPGEGKTFTAMNLALSIAQEKDKTVLLVDCDVAKQAVSRMLDIDKLDGLVDVLESQQLSIGDVMLQTDIQNLRVLTAGRQDEYVAELLASQRMIEIVSELANRYNDRIIILDGPPMLPTPQTQILVGLVGQVVFVVEAGKTPQAVVDDALEMIPPEKAAGIVLNKNQGLSVGGDYYGYYGYGSKQNGSSR